MRLWPLLAFLALPAAAQDCAEGMRPFEHVAGATCIPESPQRIVSVRGEQFTAPLRELGAPMVASAGRTDDGKNGGAPYPRGAFDLFDLTFEDSGLTWIGDPNSPDLEAIAAVRPDLILIPDWQEDLLDRFEAIAPTVAIGIHSNPMLERYRLVADAAGMLPEYEAGLERYRARLATARRVVADRLGDPSGVSVVIAEVFADEGLVVMGDLGVANEPVSVEMLPELQADFMIGTYNFAFGEPPSQRFEAWGEVLHAPRHDQHFLIDREPMRALGLEPFDADTDGTLDAGEPHSAFAARGVAAGLDVDGDALLDPVELARALHALWDTDEDGALSVGEWDDGVDEWFGEDPVDLAVEVWDRDGDGTVSEVELAAARGRALRRVRRRHRRAPGGRGAGRRGVRCGRRRGLLPRGGGRPPRRHGGALPRFGRWPSGGRGRAT